MKIKLINIIIVSMLASVLMGTGSLIANDDYKEYKPVSATTLMFEISFDRNSVEFTSMDGDKETFVGVARSDISVRDNKVFAGESVLCDNDGITIEDRMYEWNDIHDIEISELNDLTIISFYKRTAPPDRPSRVRRGNIISYSRDVTVYSDEFVRGIVFSVIGDIRVEGEVNRDVVSLFGDVDITSGALARGDVASVTGRIDASKKSSIYGEIYSSKDRKRSRRRGRFYRSVDMNEVTAGLLYNRVDGAHPWIRYSYDDGDSLLPRVQLQGGYAFESERWRYEIGVEQTLFRDIALTAGGKVYRILESEDDAIIEECENTFFALTFTEDFKDYYEAEGGTVFLKASPMRYFNIETGFNHMETNWYDGRKNLWSIFGGDKQFRDNFSTVPSDFRSKSIGEIDTTSNASLYVNLKYDNRDKEEPFDASAWVARANLEWSNPDINSDFDYTRYSFSLQRNQEINRRTMFIGKFTYGNSDGYLPMYKRFYLGGLGTLRGYNQKEYMGTEFWMANAEYRFNFPRSTFSISVLYDMGQIANDTNIDSSVDLKQSLGVALYLSDDVRLSLAKRLDRSEGDTPRFYARLSHSF